MALVGPLWIAAVVLGIAGLGKMWRATAAQGALRSLGLAHGIVAVRSLGLVEVALSALVIVRGGRVAHAGLALFYVALAAASARLRRTPQATPAGCGCFGASSAPVGAGHVALNVAAASIGVAAAIAGSPSLPAVAGDLPAFGIAHGILVATGSAAVIAAMTVLPELRLAARPQPAADPRVHVFGPTITRKAAPSGMASTTTSSTTMRKGSV